MRKNRPWRETLLDLLEFYMSLEKVFKIQISDEDAEFMTTIEKCQVYLMDQGVLS